MPDFDMTDAGRELFVALQNEPLVSFLHPHALANLAGALADEAGSLDRQDEARAVGHLTGVVADHPLGLALSTSWHRAVAVLASRELLASTA